MSKVSSLTCNVIALQQPRPLSSRLRCEATSCLYAEVPGDEG